MSSAGRSRAVTWGAGRVAGPSRWPPPPPISSSSSARPTIIERQRNIILQVEQLLSTMKDAETGQRGYLITGDETLSGPLHVRAQAAIEGEFAIVAGGARRPRGAAGAIGARPA